MSHAAGLPWLPDDLLLLLLDRWVADPMAPSSAAALASATADLHRLLLPATSKLKQARLDFLALCQLLRKTPANLSLAKSVCLVEATSSNAAALGRAAAHGNLRNIKLVNVSDTRASAGGGDALEPLGQALAIGALPRLQHLNLSGNLLSGGFCKTLEAACETGALSSLIGLNLSRTTRAAAALAQALAGGARLACMKQLYLADAGIDDAQVENLCTRGVGGLGGLQELYLCNNLAITDNSLYVLSAVLDRGALPELQRLYVPKALGEAREARSAICAAAAERGVRVLFR